MAHNLDRWTTRIGLGEPVVTTKTLRRRFFSIVGRAHPLGAPPHFASAPALALGKPVQSRLGSIASPSTPILTAAVCHRPAIRPFDRSHQLAPTQSAKGTPCPPHFELRPPWPLRAAIIVSGCLLLELGMACSPSLVHQPWYQRQYTSLRWIRAEVSHGHKGGDDREDLFTGAWSPKFAVVVWTSSMNQSSAYGGTKMSWSNLSRSTSW